MPAQLPLQPNQLTCSFKLPPAWPRSPPLRGGAACQGAEWLPTRISAFLKTKPGAAEWDKRWLVARRAD